MTGGARRPATKLLVVASALLLSLAGCSSAGDDDQPGAVTADEAGQLNDAAAMLDANSIDLNAVTADNMEAE